MLKKKHTSWYTDNICNFKLSGYWPFNEDLWQSNNASCCLHLRGRTCGRNKGTSKLCICSVHSILDHSLEARKFDVLLDYGLWYKDDND